MIQLVLKSLRIFCALGGSYVAPFLIPLLNPSSCSILVICFFLPIWYSSPSILNSYDNKTVESNKSFYSAFGIYYVIMVIVLCSLMQSICDANPM